MAFLRPCIYTLTFDHRIRSCIFDFYLRQPWGSVPELCHQTSYTIIFDVMTKKINNIVILSYTSPLYRFWPAIRRCSTPLPLLRRDFSPQIGLSTRLIICLPQWRGRHRRRNHNTPSITNRTSHLTAEYKQPGRPSRELGPRCFQKSPVTFLFPDDLYWY